MTSVRTHSVLYCLGVLLLVPAWNAAGQVGEGTAESTSSPFTVTGESIVAVLGCVDRDDSETTAGEPGALRLTHVQRGSISVAGITGEDGPVPASASTPYRTSDGDVQQGVDAYPVRLPGDSAAMLPRTEYALAPLGDIDLAPYLGHQVRMTGVLDETGDEATLQVMRVRPIGALCAGRH